ncbi:hypothetical protein PAAL109150_05585 [Paenibacillus alkaliterrae]
MEMIALLMNQMSEGENKENDKKEMIKHKNISECSGIMYP